MSNFLLWWEQLKADFITCFVTKERWRYITRGLGNTLKIALVAVLIGIAIGSIVAIVRSAHDKNIHEMRPGLGRTLLKIANAICKVYLTVIRGTPVMIQLSSCSLSSLPRRGTACRWLCCASASIPARMWPKLSGPVLCRWITGRVRRGAAWGLTLCRHVVYRHSAGAEKYPAGPGQ